MDLRDLMVKRELQAVLDYQVSQEDKDLKVQLELQVAQALLELRGPKEKE